MSDDVQVEQLTSAICHHFHGDRGTFYFTKNVIIWECGCGYRQMIMLNPNEQDIKMINKKISEFQSRLTKLIWSS